MKKTIKKLLLVFFLLLIYTYILAIESFPNDLVVFEGENITMKTLLGIHIKTSSETLETSSSSHTNLVSQKPGQATLQVSLFNSIPLKEVEVDILPKTKVIPLIMIFISSLLIILPFLPLIVFY